MFLTTDDLRQLTGYRQFSKQADWLRRHHFPFIPDDEGRPKVLRSVVETRLGGYQEPRLILT